MIHDRSERMRLALDGRELTITITHGDETRLRMFLDRINAAIPDLEPLDPDDDLNLEGAIRDCLDCALGQDEEAHGLHGFPWGDVVSLDVAREMFGRGDL